MRWFRSPFARVASLALYLAASAGIAQTLESVARAHGNNPSPQTLANLLSFAARHPSDREGALALLRTGYWESGDGQYDSAIEHLEAARKRLPQLADYASFWLASARVASNQFDRALRDLDPVFRATPLSPLVSRAVLLAARAHLEKGNFQAAIGVLESEGGKLQQPQGDMLLAEAHEMAGNLPRAAAAYQQVFYRDPLTPEAAEAEVQLKRLQAALGENYPPPMPRAMLTRAARLLDAGDHARARREFESLIPQLGGTERDLARVRAGVTRYVARDTRGALAYLRSLQIASPEADAERLHYILACARRLDRVEDFEQPLTALAGKYPDSRWRLESLIAAGNYFLLENDGRAEPLFRACYEGFAGDPRAAYCHWRITWPAYLRRAPEAAEMLRTHVLSFPGSDKAGAALYYLGRLAEGESDYAAAKGYYVELQKRYPNYYYHQVPGRELLAKPEIGSAVASPAVVKFLSSVQFPARSQPSFEADAAARERIERARLLALAALDEWAEGELRHGSTNEGRTHVFAYELARMAARRGSAFQALRSIKSFAPGYLFLPVESAPLGFWRLAFPLPFREAIEKHSREWNLDPFLIAALIRQESEFNPEAVSRARARGLMQVMPPTGAQIARRLGIKGFNRNKLFDPEISIRLGTYHFRQMLDQLGGNLERTLAAYNAGKSRVDRWQSWANYQEPSEFIETIPFSETRDYVQIVLRNAAMYRRLYGSGSPAVTAHTAQ